MRFWLGDLNFERDMPLVLHLFDPGYDPEYDPANRAEDFKAINSPSPDELAAGRN